MAQTFSGFNVPQRWGQKTNYQGGQGGQLVTHALITWRAIKPRNGIPPGTISGQWEQVPDTITSPNVAQAVQAALPPPKPIAPKVVVTGSRPVNVSSNNVSVSVFQGSGDSAFSGLVPAPPNIAGTALFLREDGTWAAAGGGGGTVTSVGLALPAEFTVSGSPVIASGTLTGAWASETNNLVFAGPAVVPGTPTFRALVFADLPAGVGTVTSVGVSSDASYLTVGATPVTTSGTITVNKTTGLAANQFVATPSGAPGTADLRAIVPADLAGTPGAGKYWDGAGSGAWTTLPAPGTGTVTSVAMSVPSFLSVAGSPVTTSGTFAVTLQTQTANTVFSGPTTGIAATPTFRSLVAADLPNTAVTPGSYTYSSITVDAQGRLTSASSGAAPTGTVTSVGLSLPAEFTLSGTPVTSTGTLTGVWASAAQHAVFAGPSGSAGTPSFRALIASDIPSLSYVTSVALTAPSEITVGGSPITSSGTLALTWANESANLVFAGPASGAAAAPTFRAPVLLDVPTTALGTGSATSTTVLCGDRVFRTVPASGGVSITQGLYASLPGSGTQIGDIYISTDGPYTFVWTGVIWQPYYRGQFCGVPGPSGGWTQVNFGGKVTLSDAAGIIGMQILDTAALNWRIITKATTATPYHRETFIRASLLSLNTTLAGFYFYDGTKLMGVECLAQSAGGFTLRVQKITNVTTAGATPFTTNTAYIGGIEFGGIWIRLGNNGTNLTFDWALERGDWNTLFSEAVGTFITPTSYGPGGACITGTASNGIRIQFLADTLTT